MRVRKIIFWLHLLCGILAGVVIAIMSATGVAIAFEHEILEWTDRDVRQAGSAAANRPRLTIEEIGERLRATHPSFKPTQVIVPRGPALAYEYYTGRELAFYVDPHSGLASPPKSSRTHDLLHKLEDWHRWLGMEGNGQAVGKAVTGVCNFAFLLLCVTGLYLWFPRRWNGPALRALIWFVPGRHGRARDHNWHNVIGFWCLPVLIVLVGTAVVFSFAWAHRLVFALAGEPAPEARGPGILGSPAVEVPPAPADHPRIPIDQILVRLQSNFSGWESIALPLEVPPGNKAQPLNCVVFEPAPFATRGRIQVAIDPFRGDTLSKVGFGNRSRGVRARIWVRFLHTGEAFGWPGKIVATVATAGSLILVYTGFALSWRRFFSRGAKLSAPSP
ncbi:MAG: PepSY domain-containing protein [Verrucomicrobiales bacterium]|nr:PepSY domain-containing protein [Verrucomicrobiales bacterium]